MADIAELGLDTSQFTKALQDVEAELKDLSIEAIKLNAEIKLLERNMFLAGGGTKAQADELKKLNAVAEDFGVQIKKAKEEQRAFKDATAEAGKESSGLSVQLRNITAILGGYLGFQGFQSFFTKLTEATKDAREFREEIDRLANTGLGGGLTQSFSDLAAKVKDADSAIKELTRQKGAIEGFFELLAAHNDLDAGLNKGGGIFETARNLAARKAEQLQAAQDARVSAQEKIVEKEKEETKVLELQLRGLTDLADLKKIELDFDNKINEAQKTKNAGLVEELETQKRLSLEIKERLQLSKELEKENAAIVALGKKEADESEIYNKQQNKKAKEEQDTVDLGRKEAQESAEYNEKKNKEALKDEAKSNEELGKREADELAAYNKKQNKQALQNQELSGELTVTDLARRGNRTAANKEKVAQDYDRKIREAIKSGNVEGEELLRKQANAAQANSDVEEAQKTPADRRAERAAGRARDRNEANADRQNKDLDDRLARGAKGEKNSRLEQRREENARNAARANQQDQDRNSKDQEDDKGYGKEDRNFLREIRDSLKPKD